MRSAACLTLLLSSAVQALLPSVAAPRFSLAPTRAGAVTMAGPVALAKKTAVLEEVRSVMAESQLMFCVRSEGLKVNEINNLRMKLPEGVQLKCVKNTLVNIASKEYEQFNADDIGGLLHYSNYWFFASEDKMRVSLQIWEDFRKATSKKDTNEVIGGVFDGKLLDGKGVETISKLPTKQELMQTTATLLNSLPLKLARALDQAGAARLARGLDQARGKKMLTAVKLAAEKQQ